VKYINGQSANKPFYLYLTFNAPHTPYQAPKEYVDRYQNIEDPTRRTYAGMVTCLDDEDRRVVAALDKKGLRDNTLILFHSDNGGTKNAMFAGQMADLSKTKIPCDNGPYRDGKGSLFEGGTRGRLRQLARSHQGRRPWTASSTPWTSTHTRRAGRRLHRQVQAARRRERLGHHRLGKPSPRTEVVYNVEPFRGAVRQGDWKLIWRTLIPTSVDLYNLAAKIPTSRTISPPRIPTRWLRCRRASTRWARNPPKPLASASTSPRLGWRMANR
jgi:arylsulfatase A-like enzyme